MFNMLKGQFSWGWTMQIIGGGKGGSCLVMSAFPDGVTWQRIPTFVSQVGYTLRIRQHCPFSAGRKSTQSKSWWWRRRCYCHWWQSRSGGRQPWPSFVRDRHSVWSVLPSKVCGVHVSFLIRFLWVCAEWSLCVLNGLCICLQISTFF